MARSPLFARVQRAVALAALADRTGRPVDELAPLLERTGVDHSRRAFLRASMLAGLGAALGACTPARLYSQSTAQVAIVGAGIAGLTAAYRLRQAGVAVRVFEAQTRIGGRMLSLRDFFPDGQVAELGAELIDTEHTHIRGLAQELGLTLDDFHDDDQTLDHDLFYFGGQRYTGKQVAEAFVPLAQAILRDLATLEEADEGEEITYATPLGAQALDAMTLSQWLDRAGASGWVRRLIEVAYTTEMGLEPHEQSALNLLTLIGTDPGKFEVFGSSDERFHVRGGNDLIIKGLGERLANLIDTDATLDSLRETPSGRFVLTLSRGASVRQVTASHVVLALPFTLLRRANLVVNLTVPKVRAINELRYGTNAKLMMGFRERIWRQQHRSNGSTFSDMPLQTTWETSRLQPGAHGILTNFVGGRHGVEMGQSTPAVQAGRAVADLDRMFPGIDALRAGMKEARFHWPTNPYVLGSYACFGPGQWTGMRGLIGEPAGRVIFAGEHCSMPAQGFMEGGCETGTRAANMVLQDLGLLTPQAGLVRRLAYGAAA